MKKYKINTDQISMVEESPTLYYSSGAIIPLSSLSAFQKIDLIKKGITKTYLQLFKKVAALDYDSLAKALSVTRATLINKKGTETFNYQIGEKIISLADLYSFGYDVFEEKSLFNQWMMAPNKALGGMIPFDLVDTQYGRTEVQNLIGRAAYGVYS